MPNSKRPEQPRMLHDPTLPPPWQLQLRLPLPEPSNQLQLQLPLHLPLEWPEPHQLLQRQRLLKLQ